MATQQSIMPDGQEHLVWDRLFRWSMFWLKIGIWIVGAVFAVLNRRFPHFFSAFGYLVGAITGVAFFYIMHYLVLTSCGRNVRWICVPLIALIDILSVSGLIVLVLRTE